MSRARAGAALVAMTLALPAAVRADPAQDYVLHCQGCHGADGRGVLGKVPAIADSIPRLIAIGEGREFLMRVPGAASSRLSDARLAAVLNWLVERYAGAGPQRSAYTAVEVGEARHRPLAGVHRTRLDIAAKLVAAGLEPPSDY